MQQPAPLFRPPGLLGWRSVGRATILPCEATDAAALEEAFTRTERELGVPTLLILCASTLYRPGKLHTVDDADITRLLALDVASQVAACKRAIPGMMEARFGRVVAIGSLAARLGHPGATLYSASKAFLEGLVRGLAVDYSRRGITANAIAAGPIDTERLRRRLAAEPDAEARLTNATAARRIPSPDELASLVAYLCSPQAAAITGAVIDFTAGAHLANQW